VHLICDQAAGAWARLFQSPTGGWTVRQGGPVNLWDDIGRTHTAWQRAGQPPHHEFTITPDAQTVRLDTPDGPLAWTLPNRSRNLGDPQ
jgi:hypothetical protein